MTVRRYERGDAMKNNEIFSISEAAQYLGVFALTLRNWEKKGNIRPFRTPGGHRRFKRSELDKIINNTTNAENPPLQ
jgi:putative resolvase